MVKHKLERSPIEVIIFELPDGGELRLEIKNPTVPQSRIDQRALINLDIKWKADEITTTDYSVDVIKILCNEFDESIFDDLEVEHLGDIAEKITEAKEKAEERKKKAKSSSFTKSSGSGSSDSAKKK